MRQLRRFIRKYGAGWGPGLPVKRKVPRHFARPTDMRPGLAIVAVVVACATYLLGASGAPSASGSDIGGQVGVSKAMGIDSCELPGVQGLRFLWNHEKKYNYRFAYIGFYVGGAIAFPPGGGMCNRPSKAQINKLHAVGYDFLPIMDGRQPPCSEESTLFFSEDPTNGFRKAREAAAQEVETAVKKMKELGFTTPGSIVYYDIESFVPDADHPHCLAATKEFINNWDRKLLLSYGASSGLYGPTNGAKVKEFWNLEYNPDDLWFSEYQEENNRKLNEEWMSVWAVPNNRPPKNRLPDNFWPVRRLHQWEKDAVYESTVTGKEFKFDLSCAMGLVAGSGEKREETRCQAK
jgi:hypothetical protein